MTPRERAIDEAVKRELALLGEVPSKELGYGAQLDYLYRLFDGGSRILRMPLPPETWGERIRRWLL